MVKAFALIALLHSGGDRVDSYVLDSGLTADDCHAELVGGIAAIVLESGLVIRAGDDSKFYCVAQ